VPPGIDPGGIAVAIIASGIDYTQPFIAARLARDGEGELIGWDLVDNDRRPFEEHDGLEKANTAGRGTAMPQTLLSRAPDIRIAPFRIDTDDVQSVHKGLALAAMTPAKIVVLDLKSSTAAAWATVREDVIRSGGKYLLVVAADEGGSDAYRIKEHLAPPLDDLDSLLIVTACVRDGGAVAGAPDAPSNAEIAVNVDASASEGLPSYAIADQPPAGLASAEVAAMAVRLLAKNANQTPAQLKTAILAVAKPFADGKAATAKSGWIADPATQFLP
jgi:hypothetical protein